jgi:hypothetical protein
LFPQDQAAIGETLLFGHRCIIMKTPHDGGEMIDGSCKPAMGAEDDSWRNLSTPITSGLELRR